MITVPPLQSSSPLISSHSDAIYWQKKVTDLYQQMKDQQNLATPSRSLSSAASLTSLSIDISASSSTFFEVLYVGKIKVWNRRVPNTFIDDALEKFRLHDQERLGRAHAPFERLTSEGNLYRRGSVDASIESPQLTPSNVPILQRSLTISSISVKTPSNLQVITPESESAPPVSPSTTPATSDPAEVKLPAVSTEDHNRTMVLQVGRTDLRLISPDRKIVLLHKLNRDIATCVQGQKNAAHFGFICRDGSTNTLIGFVFKCESDSVASEAVGAITQAFVNVDLKQTRPAVTSCEHCPMVWFHKLCVEIENYSDDKRIQATIFRRLDQLDDEEQKLIHTKFQGAETDSTRDQNEFLMMLLRAHCESKQGRHVHDTAENRSEFLNQYLGGSTIFMKAKKSLSNSFDTLLKRRSSKDDIGATMRDMPMSLPLAPHRVQETTTRSPSISFTADGSDKESEGARSRSSTIGSQNDLKVTYKDRSRKQSTSPDKTSASGSDKGGPKSPMMDIFFKVGSGPKIPTPAESEKLDAGSWRQAIFKRVAVQNRTNSIDCRNRSKEELRALWQRAIRQAILLVQMEKENAKIRAKQEENAVKRIKLEYDEMRSTKDDNIETWDSITNRESRATLKHDNQLLFQTIRQGIPRTKRGEVWLWLAERWCKKNPPFDSTNFPNFSLPYEKLLKQLTSHQHAILIDLGRTFPSHSYFSSPLGPGQLGLFNLLKAYSLLDPEVGYCQGLSFVAGVLLLHMEESQAFFLLRHLMFRRGLRAQYLPDMESLQVKLYQLSRLIHDQLPELYAHFDLYEVSPILYAAPWILTLFASQFPLGFVTRVFDLVFLENTDVVFKVALVLLSLHREQLMACEGFEEIMSYLKVNLTEFDQVSLEKVMKHVCLTDISKQLNEYQVEYAVLQEEMTAVQPQVEALRRVEIQNKTLTEQNKAVMAQLELALTNVQRLEKNRVLQQSHINKMDMQSRGLEVTIATLATFIQTLIDDKVDVEIPDDVRRILGQITFIERRKSQSQNNFMKMFKRADDSPKEKMVKSLSTGKLALPQLREAQEMVRSRSLNQHTIKQLLPQKEDDEPPPKPRPLLTQASTPNLSKPSPFFSSTHSQILQDKLRGPVIDIKIEEDYCINSTKSTSDCSDLRVPLLETKSNSLPLNDRFVCCRNNNNNNNNQTSPTNSIDSGVETPGSPKDGTEHHPLSNCDVRFTYNGTKELKHIGSARNVHRNSSPDMLQK